MFSFKSILSIFFPSRCPFCNEVISPQSIVCEKCSENIHPSNFVDKLITRDGTSFFSISPFLYEEPIRGAIHDFKFHNAKSYAVPFAKYITKVLTKNFDVKDIDYITSIPLHRSRQKERGFNQAEVFAREISKFTKVKYAETLLKIKKNKTQHELGLAERIENVKDVYAVKDEHDISGKVLLLCDDILTTGNTMAECAKVLFNAGAKKVIGATIANVSNKHNSSTRISSIKSLR